jgi:hypothetical protein
VDEIPRPHMTAVRRLLWMPSGRFAPPAWPPPEKLVHGE